MRTAFFEEPSAQLRAIKGGDCTAGASRRQTSARSPDDRSGEPHLKLTTRRNLSFGAGMDNRTSPGEIDVEDPTTRVRLEMAVVASFVLFSFAAAATSAPRLTAPAPCRIHLLSPHFYAARKGVKDSNLASASAKSLANGAAAAVQL